MYNDEIKDFLESLYEPQLKLLGEILSCPLRTRVLKQEFEKKTKEEEQQQERGL